MNELQNAIREKRNILRGMYGGMMTVTDLCRELRINRDAARKLCAELGIGVQVGKRVKFDTDEVAKVIVQRRGMV